MFFSNIASAVSPQYLSIAVILFCFVHLEFEYFNISIFDRFTRLKSISYLWRSRQGSQGYIKEKEKHSLVYDFFKP